MSSPPHCRRSSVGRVLACEALARLPPANGLEGIIEAKRETRSASSRHPVLSTVERLSAVCSPCVTSRMSA